MFTPSFTLVSEHAKTAAISNDCCFAAAWKRTCHDEAKSGDVDYHIPILGSYRHIMAGSANFEDKINLGSFSPAGFTASDVQQLTCTLADGEEVSLTAGSEPTEEGDETDSASYETVWRFTGDDSIEVDQDKVQSMLSALSSYVSGQITPTDGADPAACGFDAPLATVQVTTADGTKTLTYASGTDGYYLMVEGDGSVYPVDGGIVQAVALTAQQLKAA